MTDPMATLDKQQRQRMDELIQLLGERNGPVTGEAIHSKLAALAELQLLLHTHNANGIDQIRVLVLEELDRQQDVARADLARIMLRVDSLTESHQQLTGALQRLERAHADAQQAVLRIYWIVSGLCALLAVTATVIYGIS